MTIKRSKMSNKFKAYRLNRRKRFEAGIPTALDMKQREKERKRNAQSYQKRKFQPINNSKE
jgi:hypothetical protein